MKALIEKLCLDVVIPALLAIILGVMFLVYPNDTVDTISRVIAVIIFIFGVAQIGTGLVRKRGFSFTTTMGILITAAGIGTYIIPDGLIGVIPFFIGLFILGHGLWGAKYAVNAGRCKLEKWGVLFGLSVITIVLGVVTILNAFDIVTLSARLVGLFLVYDGISGFYVITKARKAIKQYECDEKESEAAETENEPVEVVATVIDESEDTDAVIGIEG